MASQTGVSELLDEPLPEPAPNSAGQASGSTIFERRQWPLLILILLAGLSIRVWYGSGFPTADRFWDEGYSLDNVRPIVHHGELVAVSGYYPSPVVSLPPALLIMASQAIYERTGNPAFQAYEGGSFRSAGYLVSRWLQALYGTVGLLVLFLIGRRMFSAEVGLLATLALAFCPWHIHASGYFKPDALLTTAVLLAFYGSLVVIEKRRVAAAIGTGLAIALALSAKMTGGLIALPLTFATLLPAWRFDRRRFGLLALAGVVSATAFAVTNPKWAGYLTVLSGLRRDYAMRADWGEQTRWSIPGKVAGFVLDGYGLGPVFGTAALLGFVLLAVTVFQRQTPRKARVERGMLLVLPPIYVVTYSLQTAYFKPNNFLHLLPLMALCGAWLLRFDRQGARQRLPILQNRVVSWAVTAALLLVLILPGWNYVYRSLVPTNYDMAHRVISGVAGPAPGRLYYEETWQEPRTVWEGKKTFAGGRLGLRQVERLDTFAEERLDMTDGMLFPLARLEGEQADFYQRRLDRLPEARRFVLRAKPFVRRGPQVIALAHRRAGNGSPVELTASGCVETDDCLSVELPLELEVGELVSLSVWLPDAVLQPLQGDPELQVGDQRHRLQWLRRLNKGHKFATERFKIPAARQTLRLVYDGPPIAEAQVTIIVHRWQTRTPDGPQMPR